MKQRELHYSCFSAAKPQSDKGNDGENNNRHAHEHGRLRHPKPRAQLAGDGATLEGQRLEAEVDQPSALALERASTDRAARLCVLDRDGERIQIVSLDGRAFGSVLG